MENTRTSRVAEQTKKEVGDISNRKLKDPRLGCVTVTDVELTTALQQATIVVTVLGDESERAESFNGLHKATGFIRSEIGQRIRLRKVPEITFAYDEAHDYGNKIDAIIRDLYKE